MILAVVAQNTICLPDCFATIARAANMIAEDVNSFVSPVFRTLRRVVVESSHVEADLQIR